MPTSDGIDRELPIRQEPLEPQGFIHTNYPNKGRFDRVQNRDDLIVKPYGGMWTSTLHYRDDTATSAYVDWCAASGHGLCDGQTLYRLEPDPDCRVLEIDTVLDLRAIVDEYERADLGDARSYTTTFAPVDFEAIAADFDAIRLTANGQRVTRFSRPGLYGWDSECVLAFDYIWNSATIVRRIDPEDEHTEVNND